MKTKMIITLVCTLAAALVLMACGGGATNVTVSTNSNTSKTNTTANTSTAPVNTAPANTAPANETAKSDSGDANTGVPECDEYIKKYEACLTKITKDAPQAAPGLKSAFDAQRSGFKAAASTAQGKATLAPTCKQAIETAKASTGAYKCEW